MKPLHVVAIWCKLCKWSRMSMSSKIEQLYRGVAFLVSSTFASSTVSPAIKGFFLCILKLPLRGFNFTSSNTFLLITGYTRMENFFALDEIFFAFGCNLKTKIGLLSSFPSLQPRTITSENVGSFESSLAITLRYNLRLSWYL